MTTFELVRKEGDLTLFRWSGATGQSCVFGLVKTDAAALSGDTARHSRVTRTLQEFWEGNIPCAIVIAPSEPLGDLSGWVSYLGYSAQSDSNMIAWIEAPLTAPPTKPDTNFRSVAVNRKNNQLNTQSGFNLGVLQVIINSTSSSQPAAATWDYDTATLTLTNAYFYAARLDNSQSEASLTSVPPITMSLDGDAAGAFTFSLGNLDSYNLFGLLTDQPPANFPQRRPASEIRYFHPAGKLSFPMVNPVSVGTTLAAKVSLNPALPFSASQTFFEPDLSQPAILSLFTCNSVMQTNGIGATLVPANGFGFHLAATPNYYQGWRLFYPAPFGPMTVSTAGAIKLMCGLSGLEYVTLKKGDIVNLKPGQNAYASYFVPPKAGGGPGGGGAAEDEPFSDLGQTSWLSVQTQSGYYTQADVEPFFAAGVIPQATYPSAVSSYLSDPNFAGTAPAFPFAAHSAVYDKSNSNISVAPDVFTAYESQVLVHHRYKVLVPEDAVPVFGDHTDTPLPGGGAATPTGFIAGLNAGPNKEVALKKEFALNEQAATPAAGTWSSLTLAVHTENAGTPNAVTYTLEFLPDSSGTVYPPLIQGLLHSKVFLVANNWDVLGSMQSELVVDGFAFHVKPVSTTDAYKTIALFKFQTTASLEALIETPNVWFRSDLFISAVGNGIPGVQDAIRQAIKVANGAKGTPTDPFGYFRDTIASDPNWTGVVFFHVPIDGGNMPPDLQILFAGIDGELYAHHFGIDLNHLKIENGSPQLQQSSLFGVIHYQGTPPPSDTANFAFTLLDLTVEIENSVVTDFDALVAMTIPELFDRQVSFTDPDLKELETEFPQLAPVLEGLVNTLVIKGVYQQQGNAQGSVGTVSFQRKDPLPIPTLKEPELTRVIDELQVTTAVLTPVASPPPVKGQKEVQARFSLGGQLCFSANPFGVADPADLFSFGKPGGGAVEGLDLEDLGLNISFFLNPDGARVGDTKIAADYSRIQVSQNQDGIREKSLLASFPMKVTRLVHDVKGLTPSSLAASPMNVVNIRGHDAGTPTFALECDLPLGSLGFLAGAHADISSKLVLGWGPSSATPDNDAAQVMVRLLNLSADVEGFNLEGILQVGFKDANLIRVPKNGSDVYVALFNNVALKILGITFPPNVLANFVLMAGDTDPAHQNIAWYLAAAQKCNGNS